MLMILAHLFGDYTPKTLKNLGYSTVVTLTEISGGKSWEFEI